MDLAQRTLDSMMAEMGSDSGRSTPDPDASADSCGGGGSASAQQCPQADEGKDSATRSELLEPAPRDSREKDAGLSVLATPQRRNVSFGANATFEAGVPTKVRNTPGLIPCETSASRMRVETARCSSREKPHTTGFCEYSGNKALRIYTLNPN